MGFLEQDNHEMEGECEEDPIDCQKEGMEQDCLTEHH
jgi:hypothetical protein